MGEADRAKALTLGLRPKPLALAAGPRPSLALRARLVGSNGFSVKSGRASGGPPGALPGGPPGGPSGGAWRRATPGGPGGPRELVRCIPKNPPAFEPTHEPIAAPVPVVPK